MTLMSFFKRGGTSTVARDRLQILLAHERSYSGDSDLVSKLREEILAVIAKHVSIDQDKVQVRMERGDAMSTLEVDLEIPTPTERSKEAA